MATFNLMDGGPGFPSAAIEPRFTLRKLIDFSDCPGLAAGDVIQFQPMAKGSLCRGVWGRVLVPCHANMTATVGDGGDPDGYLTALALDAASDTLTPPDGALIAAPGKTYTTSTDCLQLTIGGTPAPDGRLELIALVERI